MSPSAVSRWESGKQSLRVVADLLLRALVFRQWPLEEYPSERLADLGFDGTGPAHHRMNVGRDGCWGEQP